MVKVNIKASFPYEIKQVWDIVSSFQECSWRSDVSKTVFLDDSTFIEYTKNGYETFFNITVIEPYKRIEFEMENSKMNGYWVGLFTQGSGKTEINFTENIHPKKIYLKPFVKTYLKRQQKNYVRDLRSTLEGFSRK
ncbi:polyketide cyclase [Tetragenococcus halophilus subsp. flandriensis]|uniref:SRPBCC family protein n=1 Tax=Tetragenococcus halophilus TaxID=51669 RepID=UPI0023EA0EDD|nr:SRPBCC family protein [Tetragenococcus halophilus]GMA08129.1 polyketide cyclase [Tetragenococcus halophilus subsp. flandriensis]